MNTKKKKKKNNRNKNTVYTRITLIVLFGIMLGLILTSRIRFYNKFERGGTIYKNAYVTSITYDKHITVYYEYNLWGEEFSNCGTIEQRLGKGLSVGDSILIGISGIDHSYSEIANSKGKLSWITGP